MGKKTGEKVDLKIETLFKEFYKYSVDGYDDFAYMNPYPTIL